MKTFRNAFVVVMAAFAAATSSSAATIVYNVALSGTDVVPAVPTTAGGFASLSVDDVADTVDLHMTFAGLLGGNATAALIHCCAAANANGPVVLALPGFPVATAGTYSHLFTGVSPTTITGIESNLAYISVHDSGYPFGEIRGNIIAAPVPEPDALALIFVGMVALFAISRLRAASTVPARFA